MTVKSANPMQDLSPAEKVLLSSIQQLKHEIESLKKAQRPQVQKDMYNTAEFIRLTGISYSTFQRYKRKGLIATFKVGGAVYIPHEEYKRMYQSDYSKNVTP
jgi:intergrase/recombinase